MHNRKVIFYPEVKRKTKKVRAEVHFFTNHSLFVAYFVFVDRIKLLYSLH